MYLRVKTEKRIRRKMLVPAPAAAPCSGARGLLEAATTHHFSGAARVPADPALGPPLCPEHLATESKQGHYAGHDYTARGAVETNGYNSFLKKEDYPEMHTMHLWPTVEVDGAEEDYSHEQRHVPYPNPNLNPNPSPSLNPHP